MIYLVHGIAWICAAWMFHDLMTGIVNILNTMYVERVKVKLAELEALRLDYKAQIISARESRKAKEWDRV
jgi:hypothetical protein